MGTYLQKTNSSPSSQRQFTVSTWVKVCREGNDRYMWSMRVDDSNWIGFRFATNGCVILQIYDTNSTTGQLQSNAFFRDPSSWYHFVVRVNTNDGTADDRLRIYVNGTQLTSFSNRTNLPSGYDIPITGNFQVATSPYSSQYNSNSLDGYLTDFNYCDNYSYAPTSFAETDSTTGEWKPIVDFTGVSYGNNGFRCEFGNAAALGTDTSGNSNTLTVNNAGTGAQTVDTADNNFCTLSPLSEGADATLTKGNLEISYGNNTRTCSTANMGVSSGKWYWEFKTTAISASPNPVMVGIGELPHGPDLGTYLGQNASGWGYAGEDGTVYNSGSGSAYGATYTTGDIIGVAFDADNGNLYFYKNGTIQNSGTAAATGLTSSSTGFYYPAVGKSSGVRTFTAQANFGNSPFTIASGNADANGFGNFEYAVPSGYYALCTKNINSYG